MGTKILKGKFMPQYRTAAQWRAADPVLLRGELAVESDTLKFKFGDGTTTWNNLEYVGGGADSSEVIMISDAESISKAVTSVEWRELGQIRPVIIFDPAGVAGLPADVPSNCTLVGNVQKVDDGTISSDDGYVVTLNVFQEDNFLSGIWYQILLNSAGEVIEEKKYSLGGNAGESLPFDGPIPGYETVYSGASIPVLAITSGAEAMINFDKAIPAAQMFASKARFMIEAVIASGSSHIGHVPIAIIKPITSGQTAFEYMIQSVSTGTSIGKIKLIITSWIRESGTSGDITGCNLMMQCSNINPSMNYKLGLNMYVKAAAGGGKS